MSVELLTEHYLEFLSLKGGCTGLSESTLVKIPHCWKSHVMAKLLFMQDAKGGKEEKEEKHDKGAAAAKGKKEKEEKGGAKKGTHKYESAMLLLYAMLAYVFVDPVMHSFI